jgi:serine-type D-Ala-D-Ala carboxypeptidase/endopeptidase (penicillin-binding protein 4)
MMMRDKKVWFWMLAGWVLGLLTIDCSYAAESVPQLIINLLNKKTYKTTQFSIEFMNLESGREVFSYHDEVPLIPASNLKLVTTAAAIDQLGPDFTYQTAVGLLGGDLAVIAAGDPLIGDPVIAEERKRDINYVFQKIYGALSDRGVTAVAGDLIIDDSFFDDVRFHPSWPVDQANRWYAAQIAAMNLNNNCLDINLTPGKSPGQLVQVSLVPQTQYAQILNKCSTIQKGSDTAWGARSVDSNAITLMGACRQPIKLCVTIDRPSAYFGYVLAEYLVTKGIPIKGKLVVKRLRTDQGRVPPELDVIYTHQTTLADVITRCNQNSLNMAAECLYKTLGAYYGVAAGQECRQGTWETGREAVNAFLKKIGVPADQYLIDDGCGLSKKNRISAAALTAVLKYTYSRPAAEMYQKSLAEPGEGTMRKRHIFRESRYQSRIMVKTGYVAGTRCMSGYCRQKDGQWLAFSILTNNCQYSTNELMQQIIGLMID